MITDRCKWRVAWVGRCTHEAVTNGLCEIHTGQKCCSCGAEATHECEETGQFVCGCDLCDDCEHTIHEDGTNGGVGFGASLPPEGMGSHCRKSEQKFKPWYMREEAK